MFMSLTFIENGSERNKFMEAQDLWTEVPENGQMDVLLAALRAAAEPTRLRIVALLTRGELTVSELVHILGQSQPRISRHLKLLTEAGLLTRHREGSWVFHRLAESGPGAEVAQHLNALLPDEGVRDHVLSQDRERLGEVKRQRAEAAAAYFRDNAESWDTLRSLHVDDAEVEKVISRLLPRDGIENLLDVGTGTGRMLELLAPRARRAQGIDLSREMLAVARANLERADCGNCQVRQADLYQLPYPAAVFDAVIVHQVLHFLDQPAAAIVEVARVLAPGGNLVVVDFLPHDQENLRQEHEHRRLGFADKEIGAWFGRAGLTAKETEHLSGAPLTVAVWVVEKPPTDTKQEAPSP